MEVKSPAISNILKCRPLKYTHFAKCYDFHCYSYLGATKGHKVADIMHFFALLFRGVCRACEDPPSKQLLLKGGCRGSHCLQHLLWPCNSGIKGRLTFVFVIFNPPLNIYIYIYIYIFLLC